MKNKLKLSIISISMIFLFIGLTGVKATYSVNVESINYPLTVEQGTDIRIEITYDYIIIYLEHINSIELMYSINNNDVDSFEAISFTGTQPITVWHYISTSDMEGGDTFYFQIHTVIENTIWITTPLRSDYTDIYSVEIIGEETEDTDDLSPIIVPFTSMLVTILIAVAIKLLTNIRKNRLKNKKVI